MKLDQLQYFVETAKNEHIGLAAKTLNISPSAISHSISSLETELGQKLFQKQGKRIYLTGHGKLLAQKGQILLDQAARLKEEIQSEKIELREHFKMGASHQLFEQFFLPLWLNLDNGPLISAELSALKSSDVLKKVAGGDLDLGVYFTPQFTPLKVKTQELFEGTFQFVMGVDHPLAKMQDLTKIEMIQKLNDYPAALVKSLPGVESCQGHPLFENYGLHPQVKLFYDNYGTGLSAVEDNAMWTLVPDILLQKRSHNYFTINCGHHLAFYHINAIYPENRILSPILVDFIEELKGKFNTVANPHQYH